MRGRHRHVRHPHRRYLRSLAALALLAVAVATASGSLWLQERDATLDHVNYWRQWNGLSRLQPDYGLNRLAYEHAKQLAECSCIYHSPEARLTAYPGTWESLGENVGVGPTVDSVVRAWMKSPPHNANMLGDFKLVGVGNYRGGGAVYVVLLVMRRFRERPRS